MADAFAHADDLGSFVHAAPSSYHAAAEVARRLTEAGFTELEEDQSWPAEPGGYLVRRDGAVIAWVMPADFGDVPRFRILGAHTDSPGFRFKPELSFSANGWLQGAVEVYGGPLLNSWLDRELELAGRVITTTGETILVRTGPLLRIPQLAIHLDRDVSSGLSLDRQRHTAPVYGLSGSEHSDLLELVAHRVGRRADQLSGHDLVLADTAPATRFGLDGAFLSSGRLDDLSSVHAGVVALLEITDEVADVIPVLACFDHEEVGSASRSGASGPFLEDVTDHICATFSIGVEDRLRGLAGSWCLSADAGHGVHPNYPEKHDPTHRPLPGSGPLLKVNANQRYATDAVGAALWDRICNAADVPYQSFVSHNAVPCGSTIGPLTATRLGIRTVDVGVPLLSMHSAREMCHVDDAYWLTSAITEFFRLAD